MSGGSYNYAYSKIEDLAENIQGTTPLRKAFKEHLRLVATACHDIEWVDSCDKSNGDEDAAIRAALGHGADALAMKAALTELLDAIQCVSVLVKIEANRG